MKLSYASQSHVGMRRTHNEDSLLTMPEERLFLVADGMGGHASGEVASQLAVETIANFFRATAADDEVTWPFKAEKDKTYQLNRLVTAVKLANLRIYEAAAREGKNRGMGTTVAATFFSDEGLYVAHVGDSRVYRIRDKQIELRTEDHSLLNDYIRTRNLTQTEIDNFPHKNVIVRALGMKDGVEIDHQTLDLRAGDVFVICSDGLSGMIDDAQILAISLATNDLEECVGRLIMAANMAGGNDNVTVVAVRLDAV